MRQWRILHSESSMGWGGQEVRVFAELCWMRAQGHGVVLAAHPRSAIAREAEAAGIPLYPLRTHKALLPFEVLRLAGWLVRHRVDVVNTHSSNDGWLAGLAARVAGRPMLIRSRHIEVDYPNRFWSGLGFRLLPHQVLTTSQRIADRLVEELGVERARIESVPTGVDLERFRPDLPGTLKQELGLGPEAQLVGMISVLRSWKGHATFLEAAEQILARVPGRAHFIIAGDGPGREELARNVAQLRCRDAVTLLGHRDDVPNLLASLDVLALPSYAHEGIPQIVLQAQAMGRAVIASSVGGIPEIVQDGVNGLLVPPRDAAALAEKMTLLLNTPGLRRSLGAAGRARVEEEFSLDTMGRRLLWLYEDVERGRKQD
jgi:glycosyltransferase involved in cell wall biosynthesis